MRYAFRRSHPLLAALVAALCVAALASQFADARPSGHDGRPFAHAGGDDGDRQHGRRWRELQQTLRETDAAIHAITSGDAQPYIALWEDSPDITLFGAWGPIERGPDALRETFEWVAGRFGPAGGLNSENTIVQMSGSLAYTVGFERGMVQVDGRPLAPMTIRVTHQYRYAHGEWRLMHRHADFPPADQRPDRATGGREA
jgi:ketosteroid isomerase-like protein